MDRRTVFSLKGEQPVEAVAEALLAGIADWPLPIYACLRRGGRRLWHGWADGDHGAWLAGQRRLHPSADRMELFLSERCIPWTPTNGAPPHSWTGIFGIEVRRAGQAARMPPSQMIAANHTWSRALDRCRAALGEGSPAADEVLRLSGTTLVVPLDPPGPPRRWSRSGPPVPLEAITDGATAKLAHQLGDWLVRHTGPDGRLVYKYWPSRGRESGADNTVRQFMGTLALGRYARWSGRADARDACERNIDRQLRTYYRELPDGSGAIVHGGTAKLGAAAIAGLVLLEAAPDDRRRAALDGIVRGIELLWRSDGAFRTFHFPAERNDNQNFYPGEAALFWAHLYTRERDGAVLARLLRSLDHYRDWHRRQRNPAFIPWHAQAHAALHAGTGMTDRIPFVFEMIDWLLPMQQWEDAPAEDMRGRFYDPRHPEFGPPHAASTGAYLEGLAAGIALARAADDAERLAAYTLAFRRGVRNIAQLCFGSEDDLLYISRPDRVNGAVRTEVYDNTIRVDNVQHALMALLYHTQTIEQASVTVLARAGASGSARTNDGSDGEGV